MMAIEIKDLKQKKIIIIVLCSIETAYSPAFASRLIEIPLRDVMLRVPEGLNIDCLYLFLFLLLVSNLAVFFL